MTLFNSTKLKLHSNYFTAFNSNLGRFGVIQGYVAKYYDNTYHFHVRNLVEHSLKLLSCAPCDFYTFCTVTSSYIVTSGNNISFV